MSGNPFNFNIGSGGGAGHLGGFRMSPRRPSVKVNKTAKRVKNKVKARKSAEKASGKKYDQVMNDLNAVSKRTGRPMDADYIARDNADRAYADAYSKSYKTLMRKSPAKRAARISGRYGRALKKEQMHARWLEHFEGMTRGFYGDY